jgi:hypothetical protein
VAIEGTVRDVILGGGTGTPGFKWTCKFSGIGTLVVDEDTGALRTTATNTTAASQQNSIPVKSFIRR